MGKKEVLIFVDWFIPGYKAGGPIQSIKNLVENLGNEFQFSIVTSNTDLGETKPYSGIVCNTWIDKGLYNIMYLDGTHQNFKQFSSILKEKNYDFVYLNSLFSFRFSMLPLFVSLSSKTKVILAPRGMLGVGALQLKASKKKLFLAVFKILNIHKRVVWHVTSGSEVEDVNRIFGREVRFKLASNLPQKTIDLTPRLKEENNAKLFFLSRINPKKNLLQALNCLAKVNPKYTIEFSIIGPLDGDEYWSLCEAEIQNLPDHIKINILGAVPHFNLGTVLNSQHCLFLPTHNENYGHVIVESWQYGCLTLISDQTPWRHLEAKGVGWEYALDQNNNFVKSVETLAAMSQNDFNIFSKKAYELSKAICENPKLLEDNRQLFIN
ncbi:glycosyltransferase [Formosa sp. S-31]|uniref:glycosyltransferase n=1 Tax=Formosa sp. S-31 TaxID=2790949 RepID=UPI003EBCC4B6